jgi:hypothetical protein
MRGRTEPRRSGLILAGRFARHPADLARLKLRHDFRPQTAAGHHIQCAGPVIRSMVR